MTNLILAIDEDLFYEVRRLANERNTSVDRLLTPSTPVSRWRMGLVRDRRRDA